ncbi:MAG TPA: hypothetical protein VF530_14200 [Planctomycetota bacterium]
MTTPPTPTLVAFRFVPLAMAFGVLVLTGGAVALRASGTLAGSPDTARILTYCVAGLALALVPALVVLRATQVARLRAGRAQALELLAQGRVPHPVLALTIGSCALVEGLGLLGAVTVLLGGPWAVLAVPVLAVAVILLQVPTRTRIETLVRNP